MNKIDRLLSSYSEFSKMEIILRIREIVEKMRKNNFTLQEQAEVVSRILYR